MTQQLGMFDRKAAIFGRDAGIRRAEDHAGYVWIDCAQEYFDLYLLTQQQPTFMTEDIRKWSHERGCPMPPDGRAWGGIILRAAKKERIKAVGYAPMKSRNCHGDPKTVWIKN